MLLFPFGTDREATNSGWVTILVVSIWIGLFATFKYLEKPASDYLPDSVKNVTDQLGSSARHAAIPDTNSALLDPNLHSSSSLTTEDIGFSSPRTRAADDVFSHFELDPSRSWMPSILTHEFIHRNWLPFIGNMLFLLAFGVALERWFGATLYTFLLLCASALAAASQVILLNHFLGSWPGQAIHGGSGMVAGVLGAFLRTQLRQRVKVIGAFWVTTRNYFFPAWVFVVAWAVFQTVESARSWNSTSPMVISAYFMTIAFGAVFASLIPSPFREEVVSEHRGAKLNLPPEIRIANPPIEQQTSAAMSGIRRGLAAPPPPSGLHLNPQMAQSSGYHEAVRPAIDLAWRALESELWDEARNEFSRQFSQWIKDGLSGYESLIRNLDMLRSRYPEFCLHTAMAYELGVYMRKNNEWGLCHYCLKQTLQSDPPLSETLCDKRDSMMLEMDEQMRLSRERNEMMRKNRQSMSKSTRDEFEVTGDMLSVFVPDSSPPTPAKPDPVSVANNPVPSLQQAWVAIQEERYSDARRLFRLCFPPLTKEVRTGFPKILRALERLRTEYPDFRLSLQTALELGIYLTQRNEWELALYCLNQTIPVEHRLSDSLRAKRDQAMAQLHKKLNKTSKAK